MTGQDKLTLRLNCGIPVVEVGGEWNAGLGESLMAMLSALEHAGHFDIVLNIQRSAPESIAEVRSLASHAQAFRSHHGHLDIVGTVEQLEELVHSGLASLFRFAPTEEMALSRIKRTPVLAGGPRLTARPLD